MRLFHQKGYQSTSIADVLREADANAGSLYHFFPTKQDLLLAVLEGLLSEDSVLSCQLTASLGQQRLGRHQRFRIHHLEEHRLRSIPSK